jgi:hypothetical protein
MRMRTFIHVLASNSGIKVSSHARYVSERERDPQREEPQTRPIFTHDRDGLKHTAADRYLTGGERAKAKSNELHHIIIAFNSADQRELKKLETAARSDYCAPRFARRHQRAASDTPEAAIPKSDRAKKAKQSQVERDSPYAQLIRGMMRNIEERTELSDLRYAFCVHRHTSNTHVHLLLRREYTDRETGEKKTLQRLPVEFLNGLDERGKARGGLLDASLSDALDTMIPDRRRVLKDDTRASQSPPVEMGGPEERRAAKVQNLTTEERGEYYRNRKVQNLTSEKVQNLTTKVQNLTTEKVQILTTKVQNLTTAPKDRYSVPRRDEPVPQPASSLPERYPASRPSTTREIPAAPDQTRLAANQPKVQNLTTKVHESGQILDFEASLKRPAEPAVRGPENKVPPKNDLAAETATPAERSKPTYLPVKYEVALPPAELVPVRESERYSRTRTR